MPEYHTVRVPVRCQSAGGKVKEKIGALIHETGWPTVYPGERLEKVAPEIFETKPELGSLTLCECRYGRVWVPDSYLTQMRS